MYYWDEMTTPNVTRVKLKMALRPERRDPPMWPIRYTADLPPQPWMGKKLYNSNLDEPPRYIVARTRFAYTVLDTQHPDYDPETPAGRLPMSTVCGFYQGEADALIAAGVLDHRYG